MTDRTDFAHREVEFWQGVLPNLGIGTDELVAATRLARLFVVQSRLDSIALRDFDRFGIAGSEDFRLLALLRRSGEAGLTNGDLVKQLGGSKSGTSNRLDRLVTGGVVARAPVPHDQRTHVNVLTTKGHGIADELLLAIAEARHSMFTMMSSVQISEFSDTLGQILDEVDPDA